MNDEYVAPINHSGSSAVASTAVGVAGGAVDGAANGLIKGIIVLALIGAGIGLIWGLGSAGLLAFAGTEAAKAVVIPAIVGQLGHVALVTSLCAAAGGALGVLSGVITVPFGGLFGAVNGGKSAAQQVSRERGAALELQSQTDVLKAQALQQAMSANPVYETKFDNKYNFPTAGSPLNPAPVTIQVGRDNAMAAGRMAGGPQLAAAV